MIKSHLQKSIFLALLAMPICAYAQFDSLTKQLGSLASAITTAALQPNKSPESAEATSDQTQAMTTFQNFGLIGTWGKNCQDSGAITSNQIENKKVITRSSRSDSPTYAIVDKAKLLNEKQLHYISQVYASDNNQPIRTLSGIIYKNDGKTSLVYLEIIADGKSDVVIKDGVSVNDNTRQPTLNKCS